MGYTQLTKLDYQLTGLVKISTPTMEHITAMNDLSHYNCCIADNAPSQDGGGDVAEDYPPYHNERARAPEDPPAYKLRIDKARIKRKAKKQAIRHQRRQQRRRK